MGCGAGKQANSDEIKTEMKKTNISEFDEFFDTASEALKALEELRASFQESREEMFEISRADELKDPKLIEALRVFFWSVSAHKQGKIAEARPEFSTDPAALTINCESMHYITWDFSDALRKFIGGFTAAPGRVIELTQKIKEIGEKSVEISKNAPEQVKSSGLNPLEQGKAAAYTTANCATIAKGVAKAPNVFKQVEEALSDLKECLPKIHDLISNADEVGKKAHEEKRVTISEIFDHYQTAPKKTPEEIKEDKKKKKDKKPRVSKHASGKGEPVQPAK